MILKPTITFLPEPDTEEEGFNLLGRIGWYLGPVADLVGRISIPGVWTLPSTAPPGIDPLAMRRLADLAGLLEHGRAEVHPGNADICVVWRWPSKGAPEWRRELTRAWSDNLFDVDWVTNPDEPGAFLGLARRVCDLAKAEPAGIGSVPAVEVDQALILDTIEGPLGHGWGNAEVIASASLILVDTDLAEFRRGTLVAADSALHAGCSDAAAGFRARLKAFLTRMPDWSLAVPWTHAPHWQAALPPELRARTGVMPAEWDTAPGGGMISRYLLPLAAERARVINVFSSNGSLPLGRQRARYRSEQPHSGVQMGIKATHPAFFAHSDVPNGTDFDSLAEQIARQQERGRTVKFVSMPPGTGGEEAGPDRLAGTVVSICPDADGVVGHYLGYENHLGAEVRAAGWSFTTLCNVALSDAVIGNRPDFRRALTVQSWDIGNNGGDPPQARIERFEDEVATAATQILAEQPGKPLILYLYYGSLYHAEALARVLDRCPGARAVINLFWTCYDRVDERRFAERWTPVLNRLVIRPDLRMTVSTPELQSDIAGATGVYLAVAPHPSPTFCDAEALAESASDHGLRVDPQGAPVILFPALPRDEKGYLEGLEAAEILAAAGCRTIVRDPGDAEMPEKLRERLARLSSRVSILRGGLSDTEFRAMLRGADVVVLPYRPDGFQRRTSGLLIDCLLLGVPVVVVDGTWLARQVTRIGGGMVAPSADPVSIAACVRTLLGDLRAARSAAALAGRTWLRHNSWRSLASSILSLPR